jgi:hypothetical protein
VSANAAELSSMATTLEELVDRLGPISESYRRERRDDLVGELHEAERALTAAVRRLRRLTAVEGA